ncbi:NAD-dependent epimerase/dehydratase family protein, partial [Halorubrum sp. AJ67]
MHVVVTGGAGFIGGHLATAFLRDGHDVTVFDNLASFYDPRLKEHTLDIHREVASETDGTYAFRDGDVRDAEAVREVVADA